ncbi:MAG: hypothetical protein OES57_19160, partial [Acidimicrobiia bacterium]|nr:hypothetical protein [Acidimicrobiia bacterium]
PDVTPDPPSIPSASALEADLSRSSAERGDAPICMTCGVAMQRAGSCYACHDCGATSGCS